MNKDKFEKDIEELYNKVTLSADIDPSRYEGKLRYINLEGFKLAVEGMMDQAFTLGKIEGLETARDFAKEIFHD